MLNVAAYRTAPLVACLSMLLAACTTPKTQEEARATVDAAATTLTNFTRDPAMTWLHQNLPNARGVMVCPNIFQAGFIVGGAGGRCVVMSRSSTSAAWNGPAFYKMAVGSVGLQAGAQASELVALINSEKAVNSLLSNSFKLGGDVSVAAGPVGAGTGAPVTADMVSFVRSKGLYGGINLDGSVITVDDKANENFFGHPATPVDILAKGTVHSPLAAPLTHAVTSSSSAHGK
jgi:lipid-binding SYLF domain-containing protein